MRVAEKTILLAGWDTEEARQYIREMDLKQEQVKIVKTEDGMICVKTKTALNI